MIIHSVAFRLKSDLDQRQTRQFLSKAEQLQSIPGVSSFRIFKQTGRKSNFTHALSMKFESMQDYDHYNDHPEHRKFVEQIWIPQVAEFIELDYEPLYFD